MQSFKIIPNTDGAYSISENGIVRSNARLIFHPEGNKNLKDRILKNCINKFGYEKVSIRQNGISKIKAVHRLVALTYIPNIENKPAVNHKNGVKTDNRVENLEWCTHSENMKHSFDSLGRISASKGVFNATSSKPIRQLTKNGTFIQDYPSSSEAARILKLKPSAAKMFAWVANGKRKSANGFKWKFIN